MSDPSSLDNSKTSERFAVTIKKLVDEVEEEIKKFSADLTYRTELIATQTEEAIREIGAKQKAAVNETLEEFTNYLTKMARRDKTIQKCVSQHNRDIISIKNSAKVQSDACISFGLTKLREIPKYMDQHKDEIKDNLSKIENVIQECSETSENSGQLAACVGVRTTEIQTEVLSILRDATDALYLASREGIQIVGETKDCLAKAAADIKNQIEGATIIINKCVASARAT